MTPSTPFFAVLLLMLGATFYTPEQGFAQEVFSQGKVVGKNRLTGKDLYAKVFNFPERVGHIYPDFTNGLLQVMSEVDDPDAFGLYAKEELWVYSLHRSEVLWSRSIRFSNNAVYGIDGIFVENPGRRAIGYNAQSGKRKWKTYHDIYFLNRPSRIAVAYESRSRYGNTDNLSGIDLDTGQSLWVRKITRDLGWNELIQPNDSIYFILAGGLHSVNINTGEGWSYHSDTGENDRPGKEGAGFKGSMVSNLMYDTTDVYFASKESIVRLSTKDGEPVWISDYPDDLAGNSVIFAGDSLIYMINRGMAVTPFGPVKHGLPFLAAYRKDSGHPVYFTATKDTETPVLSYHSGKDHIMLLSPEGIDKHSLTTGGLLLSENFEDLDYGRPLQFLDTRTVHSKTLEGKFESLNHQSPDLAFALFDYGVILALNADLSVAYTLDMGQVWLRYLQEDGFSFISDGERTMVIRDADFETVAELLIPDNAEFYGEVLVYSIENQVYLLDLAEMFR